MKTALFLNFLLISLFSFGQAAGNETKNPQNAFFIEVFGQGIINSFNYERTFNTDHKIVNTSAAGFTFMITGSEAMYGVPVSYNWITGKKSNHLEFGLGCSYIIDNSRKIHVVEYYTLYDPVSGTNQIVAHPFIGSQAIHYLYMTPKVGYRYQQPHGGLLFRVIFTPQIALMSKEKALKGSSVEQAEEPADFFTWDRLILDSPVLPWAGISIGYSF